MPELPDVETWKRYVESNALHQEISGVRIDASRMLQDVSKAELRRSLEGDRFSSARRHGKYLFVGTERNGWLVLHFGMTGFLSYGSGTEPDPYPPSLVIRFANECRLAGMWPRRLGRISLTSDPAAFVEAKGLGPDALVSGRGADAFVALFRGRGGSLKSALMDQKFLAGLGNVYTDEVLFQARLHPRARLSDLGEADLKRLYNSMRHVLDTAIEREADPERLPGTWLLPHRNRDAGCPRCGGALQRIKIGGRTTYACPACQPMPA